jgi:hypothetical protein
MWLDHTKVKGAATNYFLVTLFRHHSYFHLTALSLSETPMVHRRIWSQPELRFHGQVICLCNVLKILGWGCNVPAEAV